MYPEFDLVPLFLIAVAIVVLVPTLIALAVAVVGWGGSKAGVALGWVMALIGVTMLVYAAFYLPSLWWMCIPLIYASYLAIASWRRRGASAPGHGWRFGLRGVCVLTLAIALCIGGAIVQYQRRVREQRAVASLSDRVSLCEWNLQGIDVIVVEPQDDADLAHIVAALHDVSSIRTLQVNNAQRLSGRALASLATLATLRTLSCQHLYVEDADLAPLGQLTNLEKFEIEARGLTDAGLNHLHGLKNLRRVYLIHADSQKITRQGRLTLRQKLPLLEP